MTNNALHILIMSVLCLLYWWQASTSWKINICSEYCDINVTVSTILSHSLNRIFFSQTWTDVSKNLSKTDKNTEKWFSRNISGEMWSQAICVWATLIQVNQDNSASVWWTAHARNRFEIAYVVYKQKLLQKWLIIWALIDKLCSYR